MDGWTAMMMIPCAVVGRVLLQLQVGCFDALFQQPTHRAPNHRKGRGRCRWPAVDAVVPVQRPNDQKLARHPRSARLRRPPPPCRTHAHTPRPHTWPLAAGRPAAQPLPPGATQRAALQPQARAHAAGAGGVGGCVCVLAGGGGVNTAKELPRKGIWGARSEALSLALNTHLSWWRPRPHAATSCDLATA